MGSLFSVLQRCLHTDALKYGIIFSCYGLLSLFLINKGLDLTDTGYHLANQMNVATLGAQYIGVLPIYWFSDVVAAGLSRLFDGWTLLEMRGVVLALGAVQLLVLLRILKTSGIQLTYINGALIMLLGMLMTVPFGCVLLSVDYYTLPTFACYFFLLILVSFFHRPNYIKACLLAFLTVYIMNLRLTTGFILLTTPMFVVGLMSVVGKETVNFKKQLAFFYALSGLLIAAELAWIFSDEDMKRHVLSGDFRNEKVHSTFGILKSYFADFFFQLGKSFFLPLGVIFAAGYSAFKGRSDIKNVRNILQKAISILPYALAISWMFMLAVSKGVVATLPEIIVVSYVFYLLLVGVFYIHAPQFLKTHAALIVAGALIPMAIFIGTNTGLSKLGYGLPLLVVTLYFMALNLPVHKKAATSFLMVFYLSGLGVLIFKSADQFYENVKMSHVADMTYQMQHGKVKGVYTSPNSGKEVDELLSEIAKRTRNGDKIFTALSIPMIYFAADRPNVLGDVPNFDIFQPEKVLQKKLPLLCSNSELTPKLIIISKKYVFDPNWEKNISLAAPIPTSNGWGEQDNAVLINDLLAKNCRSKTVWENNYFQIQIPAVRH